MVFIVANLIHQDSLDINPYLVLGIPKNATIKQIKIKFREKMLEARNNDQLRAKICLAYDIIVNANYYIEFKKDTYRVNYELLKKENIIGYYYTIVGDFKNLVEEIERNPKLLYFKDSLQRNLLYLAARNGHDSICEYLINKGISVNEIQKTGSTALHGAAFYGQTKVVKLLLYYGAKTNIKNNFGNLPIAETMNKEIINLLNENENDPIIKLNQTLLQKNISKNLINIYYGGKIIAKKILCKMHNLPNQYKFFDIDHNWITAWHGTHFTCLESIAEIGLKPPDQLSSQGKEIKIHVHHIERGVTVASVPDWANGIFVSPSIFYCANPAYSKEISCKNELYKVFVEVRLKPCSFKSYGSTCPNHKAIKGEPKVLEYRIDPKNQEDVQVFSLTFVKTEFFQNAQRYEDALILSRNKE